MPKVVRTFEDFIKVDIYTGDSDPVYWALARARAEFGSGWATRFAVAMLAYYHTGTAAKAAEHEGIHFWDYLLEVYPTNPRGSERRHFRGEGGLRTYWSMRESAANPDRFFDQIPRTYEGVRKYCEHHFYAFGPYFQLKVCDYMDRCLALPILTYEGLDFHLPTEPFRAVNIMFPDQSVPFAFRNLCKRVDALELKAAPDFERPVGPAEVETSLCGWKTTKYKGNWFGADILDKREALRGHGSKATQMIDWMPTVPDKKLFKIELL